MPYMSVYAPTKAFVDSFTRQLQMEYRSQPIDIVLVKPGPVKTGIMEYTEDLEVSWYNAAPETFARSVLNSVSSGIDTSSGTMAHALLSSMIVAIYNLGLMPLFGRRMRIEVDKVQRRNFRRAKLESQRTAQT
jgi:short-subunit dehydrogenase